MVTKVLVADDSVGVREMLSFFLKRAGFDVMEAVDGSDALAKASDFRPGVILTDFRMPKLDGIGLIKSLRANPSFKFTPIIVLSGESQLEEKLEGKRAGATGWFEKPIRPDDLVSIIRRVIW